MRTIVVTGGASGIGKGIAIAFAKRGERVIVCDLNEEKGLEFVAELVEQGFDAHFQRLDVSNAVEVESVFSALENRYEQIDVLINNAGISEWHDPLTMPIETFDRIIDTNLRSVFLCSREAAKRMKNGGAIISMASTRAQMSEPFTEAYAASKGGIVSITHALSASFAPLNITVNCISPGWIDTGNYGELREEDHAQHFSNRVGKVEDIARMCMFLADKENNFINGENITIDGGMTKKMIYEE
jgi:NAD(P)-dependent dehydrogenase (short-subunit alcohol dehydrogenase family)